MPALNRSIFRREFVLYGAASLLGFSVDVAVLWLLAAQLSVQYSIATAIGFCSGTAVVYVLCIRHIFAHRRIPHVPTESTAFFLLGLVGLIVNVGLVSIAVGLAGAPLPIAKLLASAVTLFLNYALRKTFLFSKSASQEST